MRLALRLVFAVLRAALIAVSLTFAGWSGLMSPSVSERTALGLPVGTLSDPDRRALKQMRLMQAVLYLAPGLMSDALARAAPAGTDQAQIDAAMRAVANGYRLGGPLPGGSETGPDFVPRPAPKQFVGTGGAKFVKVN